MLGTIWIYLISNMNIGSTIKRLRKEKGMSQKEFGDACGISQTSLSQIENGVTIPHKSSLENICKVLEIPEEVLLLLSLEGADIPDERKKMFETLYPTVRDLMFKIFYEDGKQSVLD